MDRAISFFDAHVHGWLHDSDIQARYAQGDRGFGGITSRQEKPFRRGFIRSFGHASFPLTTGTRPGRETERKENDPAQRTPKNFEGTFEGISNF